MSDDLESLTTDELRHRAFHRAQEAHDLSFFWDLVKHLPASRALAGEDGSGGGLTGSVTEAVVLVRELLGRQAEPEDPLLRARYLEYLRTP